MSSEKIYDSEYVTVKFDSEKRIIIHTIHKPVADQPQIFMDALNAGAEAMKEHGITKWLSDDRKNGPLTQGLLDWATSDWNPRTIEFGWKYWANVVPADMVAAGTLIPQIHHVARLGLKMRVFRTVEEAIEWLDKVDVPS